MKITKRALMVAAVMAGLTSVLHVLSIIQLERDLLKHSAAWKEEDLDNMQAVQEMVSGYHHWIGLQFAYSAWYLVLAGLLVFAVNRLRNLN